MLKLTKKQYFIVFVCSMLLVSGCAIYDAITTGREMTATMMAAFASMLGWVSRINDGTQR